MNFFATFILMLLFFILIEFMATLFAVEEHTPIIPEPWNISGEEE